MTPEKKKELRSKIIIMAKKKLKMLPEAKSKTLGFKKAGTIKFISLYLL